MELISTLAYQSIICGFVDVHILYIVLLLHVNHFFLWFELSIWVLIFAYLKFARIFIRGSFFYNREKRESKINCQ